jgi:uncharacterized protein YbbK (DUF523 family)
MILEGEDKEKLFRMSSATIGRLLKEKGKDCTERKNSHEAVYSFQAEDSHPDLRCSLILEPHAPSCGGREKRPMTHHPANLQGKGLE